MTYDSELDDILFELFMPDWKKSDVAELEAEVQISEAKAKLQSLLRRVEVEARKEEVLFVPKINSKHELDNYKIDRLLELEGVENAH
jgi:hypothetical protein